MRKLGNLNRLSPEGPDLGDVPPVSVPLTFPYR
jgi:hypothetical protein